MVLLVIICLAQLGLLWRLVYVVTGFVTRLDADRLIAENAIRGVQQQTVLAMFEAARSSGLAGPNGEGWAS